MGKWSWHWLSLSIRSVSPWVVWESDSAIWGQGTRSIHLSGSPFLVSLVSLDCSVCTREIRLTLLTSCCLGRFHFLMVLSLPACSFCYCVVCTTYIFCALTLKWNSDNLYIYRNCVNYNCLSELQAAVN